MHRDQLLRSGPRASARLLCALFLSSIAGCGGDLHTDISPAADVTRSPATDAATSSVEPSLTAETPAPVAPDAPTRQIPPLSREPLAGDVTFVFGDTISPDLEAAAREAVGLGLTYYASIQGLAVGHFMVVADDNVPDLVEHEVRLLGADAVRREGLTAGWNRYAAITVGNIIFVRLPQGVVSGVVTSYRAELLHSMVHELTHVLQRQIIGPNRWELIEDRVPGWFVEGHAELEAWQAAEAFGYMKMPLARLTVGIFARTAEVSLAQLRAKAVSLKVGEIAVYTRGMLAADLLAGERGPGALFDIWRSMAQGAIWDTAFAEFTGKKTYEFEEDFVRYAAAHFPTYEGGLVGVVRTANQPAGVQLNACTMEPGLCFSTPADGVVLLPLPPGTYKVRVDFPTANNDVVQYWYSGGGGLTRGEASAEEVVVGSERVRLEITHR